MSKILRCGIILFYDKDTVLVKTPAQKYSFPKGKKKCDETDFETALRETFEETGFSNDDFVVCTDESGNLLSVVEYRKKSDVKYYIARLKNRINIRVSNSDELEDAVYENIERVFNIPIQHLREERVVAFKNAVSLYEKWVTSSNKKINTRDDNRWSKYTSWALRHGIIKLGLDSVITKDGYVPVQSLLSLKDMDECDINHLLRVVELSDKKRLGITVRNDQLAIRANQGHCLEVGLLLDDDLMMERVTHAYPVCIHGTNKKAIKAIEEGGLKPMNRKHIHMAIGLPTDSHVISGMRKTSKVIIYINMQKAMDNGKRFYVSENNVILTADTIEPDLFDKVEYVK